MKKDKHFETKAIRDQIKRSEHKEHSVPIYLTSSFFFDSAEMPELSSQREGSL
jgi:O-succinylhomoserine sulfhydrylase